MEDRFGVVVPEEETGARKRHEDEGCRRTLVDTPLLTVVFDQRDSGRIEFSYADDIPELTPYVTAIPFHPERSNPTDLHLVELIREDGWYETIRGKRKREGGGGEEEDVAREFSRRAFVYGSFLWMRDTIRTLGERECATRKASDSDWLAHDIKIGASRSIWKEICTKMLDVDFLPILFRLYLRHLIRDHLSTSKAFRTWIQTTYESQEEYGKEWPFIAYGEEYNMSCIPFLLSYAAVKRTAPITTDHVKLCMDTLGITGDNHQQ